MLSDATLIMLERTMYLVVFANEPCLFLVQYRFLITDLMLSTRQMYGQ